MNIKNSVEQVRWTKDFKKQRERSISIQYNGVSTIADLLIRIIISVNQLLGADPTLDVEYGKICCKVDSGKEILVAERSHTTTKIS